MARMAIGMMAAGALAVLAAWLLLPATAQVQSGAMVVSACYTPPQTYVAGQMFPLTQNTSGRLCE